MPAREFQGVVVSDKPDKTVIVKVERMEMNPLYKKFVKRTRKFAAHDDGNKCRQGDVVRIQECPPISKRKKWKVVA